MDKFIKCLDYVLIFFTCLLIIAAIYFRIDLNNMKNKERNILERNYNGYSLEIKNFDKEKYKITVCFEGKFIYEETVIIKTYYESYKYNFDVEWLSDCINIKYVNSRGECIYDKNIAIDNTNVTVQLPFSQ